MLSSYLLPFLFPLTTIAWQHSTFSSNNNISPFSQKLQYNIITQNLKLFSPPTVTSKPLKSPLLKAKDDDGDDEYINEQKAMFEMDDSEAIGKRTMLVSESIAPWRTLRVFLYFSFASGAFVGGLITLSGVVAAMNGRGLRENVDFNVEYLNLAIDFGAVAAFAIFAKLDLDKGKQLNEKVESKLLRKKEQTKMVSQMRQREKDLLTLNLSFQVSTEGQRMESTIDSIQNGAKQHVIIIAGSRKATKDALLGANLLKLDFAMSNILVVPYIMDDKEKKNKVVRPTGSGFGEDTRPTWETAPYVAATIGDGWESYIESEFSDAVSQNSDVNKLKAEGVVIVLANDGKVIRRGVGKVPWRQMVKELDDSVAPVEKIVKDDVFY